MTGFEKKAMTEGKKLYGDNLRSVYGYTEGCRKTLDRSTSWIAENIGSNYAAEYVQFMNKTENE